MILVDTSVWIDFLRGEYSPERTKLHQLLENGEDLSITGIILTEILQGIRETAALQETRQYLIEFPVVEPRGTDTYIRAAEIYQVCRKRGKTIRSTIDCLIASICLENNFQILHKDADYSSIRDCTGLQVIKV
jgi:predicted nucleic acid-binding protein